MQVLINRPSFSGNPTSRFDIYKTQALSSGSSTMFFPEDILSNGLQELVEKIRRFKELENNWDGYNADKISPEAIHDAINFIHSNSGKNLPFYFAAPGINGEVMIELKLGTRAAEIFFNSDRSTELLLFENNICKLEGDVETNIEELISFFNEG